MSNPSLQSTLVTDKELIGKDATNRQRQAARPETSVWVGASAGTGKTKVLTDRILRLLLPSANSSGTPPHQILCITFTKAAAAEMALRLNKTIRKWAILNDQDLKENLEEILGHTPDESQIKTARELFARIVDAADGLNIMTIHAFCELVLRRFPIEAGLPPSFEVMEPTQSRFYLEEARNTFLERAIQDKTSPMHARIKRLAVRTNDGRFLDLLDALLSKRRQLNTIFKTARDDDLLPQLLGVFELPIDISDTSLLDSVLSHINENRSGYLSLGRDLMESGVRDNAIGQAIINFLALGNEIEKIDFNNFVNGILTKGNARVLGKAFEQRLPLFCSLCEHISNIEEKLLKLETAKLSADLLLVAHEILQKYSIIKNENGALDFDDLIEKTADLLRGNLQNGRYKNAYEWILYKLDNGMDHVLVDEAQDTNPDQWDVIKALTDPFTDGEGARANTQRSLFIVGDEKQSIYSFQRADPAIFEKMRKYFESRFASIDRPWEKITLNASFRSVPAVLEFVDHVYELEQDKKGLSQTEDITKHISYRVGEPGHVELWPIISEDKKDEHLNWPLPDLEKGQNQKHSSARLLAVKIAGTIQSWIHHKRIIGATGKPVKAGDILILLRKRSELQTELVRALKSMSIPVEGLDRIIVEKHIAVQDLLALARFALATADDYSLACILKSPFIGWNDDQLMEICFQRQRNHSLYNILKGHEKYKPLIDWFEKIILLANHSQPYLFFSRILAQACPAFENATGWKAIHARLGEEAKDPLETFLSYTQNWSNPNGRFGLQAFVHDVENNKNEVKREMEEGSGRVRIMTVHGAKGLQAPIVFMPDTVRTNQGRYNNSNPANQVFWENSDELDIPFWVPGADLKTAFSEKYKETAKEKDAEEYKRLLYVAMTRAADELYIAGHIKDEDKLDETCWYVSLKNAMQRFDTKEHPPHSFFQEKEGTYVFSMFQDNIKEINEEAETLAQNVTLPDWINIIPEDETTDVRTVRPSLSEVDKEEAVLSPLSAYSRPSIDPRFHRGNIIHTALQFLPNMDEAQREVSLKTYLAQRHLELSKEEQQTIFLEITTILNDDIFASVFGRNSRAEIPITGILDDGQKVSGQIDRLVIEENRVLIVDFKTNRPPPENEEDVPAIYCEQLRAYKNVISKIHPDKDIQCGLLWTNIPKMMLVKV